MKPCNFPERVNQRRKDALERLYRWLVSYKGLKHLNYRVPLTEREIETLESRIVTSARHVRTKKDHTGRGKLRPTA